MFSAMNPDLETQTRLHNRAIRAVAQSHACHPDWDLDTHLGYLQYEEEIDPDALATVVAWPTGPSTAPVREYVAMWLRIPERSFEGVR